MKRRKKGRSGKIRYRGKLFSRAKLARKIGKRKAARLWCKRKRRSKKACKFGKRRGRKSSWMRLVKRFGVMGAAKRRRRDHLRRHRRRGKR